MFRIFLSFVCFNLEPNNTRLKPCLRLLFFFDLIRKSRAIRISTSHIEIHTGNLQKLFLAIAPQILFRAHHSEFRTPQSELNKICFMSTSKIFKGIYMQIHMGGGRSETSKLSHLFRSVDRLVNNRENNSVGVVFIFTIQQFFSKNSV